jgi:hypothetical protein
MKNSVNMISNGEKLKSFPIRLKTRQGCQLSPPLWTFLLLEEKK